MSANAAVTKHGRACDAAVTAMAFDDSAQPDTAVRRSL